MSDLVCNKLKKLQPYDPDTAVLGIHMDANESFIELPDGMKEQISGQLSQLHFNRYPDPLAQSLCRAFGNRYGVDPRYITAGNGSDEMITVIFNSFTQKGDKVLITEPDFSMYRFYCSIAEIEPVILKKNEDLNFDADEMIRLANENNVRLIMFSNPCNPTGQGISADEVLRILRSTHCIMVVDEAYMDFWDESVLTYAPESDKLIVLKTCSKIGFAAARIGFAISNSEFTGFIRAAKSPYNVNNLTQTAARILLEDPNYLTQAVHTIRCSRDDLYNQLKNLESHFDSVIKVFPSHANFVTVKVGNAARVHIALKEEKISVRLIANQYLRVTAGSPSENSAFLKAFETIIRQEASK